MSKERRRTVSSEAMQFVPAALEAKRKRTVDDALKQLEDTLRTQKEVRAAVHRLREQLNKVKAVD